MKKQTQRHFRPTLSVFKKLAIATTFCFTTLSANAQCYTSTDFIIPSSITGNCAPKSACFDDFYKDKENYIPNASTSITEPLYAHKTIKVIFHVINPETGSTSPITNYPNNAAGRAGIQLLIDETNWMLSHLHAPTTPITPICGTCFVQYSRFKIESIKDASGNPDIRFHNVPDFTFKNLYSGSAVGAGAYSGALDGFLVDEEKVLNIFILHHQVGAGLAGVSYSTSSSFGMLYGLNSGTSFLALGNLYQTPYSDRELNAAIIIHELGHFWGLNHTFEESCTESDYD